MRITREHPVRADRGLELVMAPREPVKSVLVMACGQAEGLVGSDLLPALHQLCVDGEQFGAEFGDHRDRRISDEHVPGSVIDTDS